MIVRTKDYAGMMIKRLRVYTNDPERPRTILGVRAFVRAPLYVSPPYVSFYDLKGESPSLVVEIRAGLERLLALEPGDFSLKDKVGYRIEEVEKGRRFRIVFRDLTRGSADYRGYLNVKTSYPEKPVVNIKIIGRFLERKEEHG